MNYINEKDGKIIVNILTGNDFELMKLVRKDDGMMDFSVNILAFEHLIDEENIMIILREKDLRPDICEAGIKRLRKEANIIEFIRLMKFGNYYCLEGMKYLSDDGIMEIIVAKKYRGKVWFDGVPRLNSWDNIVKVFVNSNSPLIRSMCIEKLKLNIKPWREIVEIIKKSGNDLRLTNQAQKFLKLHKRTEEELLFIMGEIYSLQINRLIIARLKLAEKSDSEIMELAEKTKYDFVICERLIIFLKMPSNILILMAKSGYHQDVCKTGFPLLKLTQNSVNELQTIIVGSDYHPNICAECAKILENTNRID